MNTTRFEKTIKRVEHLLGVVNNSFFNENYISFYITSATYLILKKSYYSNTEISQEFKSTFSKFYGLNRFVDTGFIDLYFEKMNKLRGLKEYNIRDLCYELIDSKGRVQFSFVTKILNLMNDEKYPIYDGNVAKVFNLYPKEAKSKDDKISNYIDNYLFINNIYLVLLPKHTKVINNFREIFNYSEVELSDLRILDIIIWKIGEKLLKKQI